MARPVFAEASAYAEASADKSTRQAEPWAESVEPGARLAVRRAAIIDFPGTEASLRGAREPFGRDPWNEFHGYRRVSLRDTTCLMRCAEGTRLSGSGAAGCAGDRGFNHGLRRLHGWARIFGAVEPANQSGQGS
jgi:hypothetical protein